MSSEENISSDLIWEITSEKIAELDSRVSANALRIGATNSYLVKRKTGGRFQFSRDPLNLMNKQSKKVSSVARM